jgi:hypothetical protein
MSLEYSIYKNEKYERKLNSKCFNLRKIPNNSISLFFPARCSFERDSEIALIDQPHGFFTSLFGAFQGGLPATRRRGVSHGGRYP